MHICQPTLPIHASVPHVHTSILYVCIFIPSLQIALPIFAWHTERSKSEREKQISYINTYTRNQEAFFFFLLEPNEKPLLADPVHPSLMMLQGGVFYSNYLGENWDLEMLDNLAYTKQCWV